MALDKLALIEQLAAHLKQSDEVARRASDEAREAARSIQTESEKKEDGRAVIEFGSLATGQDARSRKVQADLAQLAMFTRHGLPRFGASPAVVLGAVIDVSVDGERGPEERTFILLPVVESTTPDVVEWHRAPKPRIVAVVTVRTAVLEAEAVDAGPGSAATMRSAPTEVR
jgi:hypothetical protein